MGDSGNTQDNIAAPKPGVGKRLPGHLFLVALLASLALMTISNPRYGLMLDNYRLLGLDRAELSGPGIVLFLGVLLFAYVRWKFVRHSPEEQQRIDEAVARVRDNPLIRARQNARVRFLKFMVPALLLGLLIIWVINNMAGSIPQLALAREADRERIGLLLGAIITSSRLWALFSFRISAPPR